LVQVNRQRGPHLLTAVRFPHPPIAGKGGDDEQSAALHIFRARVNRDRLAGGVVGDGYCDCIGIDLDSEIGRRTSGL
jgi:hypothetical protein